MPQRILCFGSINIDDVYKVPHIVKSGETISSEYHQVHPGGKGANQSVASARAGANVFHAGKIGGDGGWLKKLMKSYGVNTELIREDQQKSTGRAIIQLSLEDHDNAIVLFPGTNHDIEKEFIAQVFEAHSFKGDWLLMQNEINNGFEIMTRAKKEGMYCDYSDHACFNQLIGMLIAFNPAPMDRYITKNYPLQLIDVLIVNEVEAYGLGELIATENQEPFGLNPPKMDDENMLMDLMSRLSGYICSKYTNLIAIVITLGNHGGMARFRRSASQKHDGLKIFKPRAVEVVDTTGAGDTFIGFFIKSFQNILRDGKSVSDTEFEKCLKLANDAAVAACMKHGAMSSIPSINELNDIFENTTTNC